MIKVYREAVKAKRQLQVEQDDKTSWPTSKSARINNVAYGEQQTGGETTDSQIQTIANMMEESSQPTRNLSESTESSLHEKTQHLLDKMPDLDT